MSNIISNEEIVEKYVFNLNEKSKSLKEGSNKNIELQFSNVTACKKMIEVYNTSLNISSTYSDFLEKDIQKIRSIAAKFTEVDNNQAEVISSNK